MNTNNPAGRARELADALISELATLRVALPNDEKIEAAERAARACAEHLGAEKGAIIDPPNPNKSGEQDAIVDPPNPNGSGNPTPR
jgi:hypothetical protein